MINFVTGNSTFYTGVMQSLINPIAIHLNQFNIFETSQEKMINVHFFKEKEYLNNVGMKGINIFLSHGLADKNYAVYKDMEKFDFINIPGPAWFDKMIEQECPKEKLFIGGYSKLDTLWNTRFEKKNDKKIILWCPTHNLFPASKRVASSFPRFEQDFETLSSQFTLVTSLHPANSLHHNPTSFELNMANIVISDFSSIIYEAWALDIPVIFPDWLVKNNILEAFPNTFEGKIYKEQIGYHAKDMETLEILIFEALINGISTKATQFMETIFPVSLRGNSGKTIANFLKGVDNNYIF